MNPLVSPGARLRPAGPPWRAAGVAIWLTLALTAPAADPDGDWADRAMSEIARIEDPVARSYANYEWARIASRLGLPEASAGAALSVGDGAPVDSQRRLFAVRYALEAATAADRVDLYEELLADAGRTARADRGAFVDSAYLEVCVVARRDDLAKAYIDESERFSRDHLLKTLARLADERDAADEPDQNDESGLDGTPAEPPPLAPLEEAVADAADPKARAAAYGKLIRALVARDAFDRAVEKIEAGVAALRDDPVPTETSKFGTFGYRTAILGLEAARLRVARKLIDAGRRDDAATQIAHFEEAFAANAEQNVMSIGLPATVGGLWLELDRPERAEAILAGLRGPWEALSRSWLAAELAAYRIRRGEAEAGLAVAEAIADAYGRSRSEVAVALAETGGPAAAAAYLDSLRYVPDETDGENASGPISTEKMDVEQNADAARQAASRLAHERSEDIVAELFGALTSPAARGHVAIVAAEKFSPGYAGTSAE